MNRDRRNGRWSDPAVHRDNMTDPQTSAPQPDATVRDESEVGRLYGPDGRTVRVVRREKPPFGFQPPAGRDD